MAKIGDLTGEDLLLEAYKKLEAIEHDIPAFNAMQDARSVIDRSKQAGMERIEKYRQGVTCTGISTELPNLDQLLGGWQNGELAVSIAATSTIWKPSIRLVRRCPTSPSTLTTPP